MTGSKVLVFGHRLSYRPESDIGAINVSVGTGWHMRKIAIRFVLAILFQLALTFSTPESGGQFVSLLIE